MTTDPKPTHTAWFLFCPVYIADPDGDFIVWARWGIFEPLFTLSGWVQGVAIFLLSMANPHYEPAWMFWRFREIPG